MKSRWEKTSHPSVMYHDGTFRAFEDIEYLNHVIPKGFTCNGVTGWRTSSKMILPSLLHDYLLSIGIPRKLCDKEFLKAMEKEKVNVIKRRLFYRIVRINSRIKGN